MCISRHLSFVFASPRRRGSERVLRTGRRHGVRNGRDAGSYVDAYPRTRAHAKKRGLAAG